MKFELPESYRAYRNDVAVRTAVDHILSADSKTPLALPADIEWKDLPAFHRAVLSAHQVRCEYAVSLIELWDVVWQRALDGWEFQSNLVRSSVAEAADWWPHKLDTYTVWGREPLFPTVQHRRNRFSTWAGSLRRNRTSAVVTQPIWQG